MRTMKRRCELLMVLQPGPPAYAAANPDPMRCCEQETWFFDDDAGASTTLCSLTVRKRTLPDERCPGHDAQGGIGTRRRSKPSGSSTVVDEAETREPMRVVRVVAPGPEGEGEVIGTAETLTDARRIAGPAGWHRVYAAHRIFECLRIHLHYTWERHRNLWVSDDGGEYGEPLTLPVANDRGEPTRGNMHYLHQIVRLADLPAQCARCDAISAARRRWLARVQQSV